MYTFPSIRFKFFASALLWKILQSVALHTIWVLTMVNYEVMKIICLGFLLHKRNPTFREAESGHDLNSH